MKEKMKRTIIGLSFVASAAQGSGASQDFLPVVMGSACRHAVVYESHQTMGIINSANCKVAYVLPAAQGKLEVPSFMATASTLLCPRFVEFEQSQADLAAAQIKLTAQLGKAKTAKEVQEIKTKIELLQKYAGTGGEIYKGKQAAIAQLVFSNDVDSQTINSLRAANYHLAITEGVDFRPAPIGTSILSFKKVNATQDSESPVISSDIPGLVKKADGSYESVLFNGSLSGQVVLSLAGACSLFKEQPRSLNDIPSLKPDPAQMASTLVANRSFQVATQSRMSYHAKINQTSAVNMLTKFRQTKSKFTVDEVVQKEGEGNIHQWFDLKVEATELDQSQLANWEALKATVTTEVASRLLEQFTGKLEELGYLTSTPRSELPQAPAAGTDYIPGKERVCSSTRILGIKVAGGCHDRIISIPVQVDGRSSLSEFNESQLNMSIEEKLTIHQPINYSFTTSFSPLK